MKLLVLLSRFPYPLDKGDKLRAFYQLRELAHRHTICLLALTDEDVPTASHAQVASFCAGGIHVHRLRRPNIARGLAIALATALPLQIGYFQDATAQRLLTQLLHTFRPDHVYCQLIRMAEYLRPHHQQWPCTLDYMDVFSAGVARRAARAPRWQRPVLQLEAQRLRRYEALVFDWFRAHSIISDQDRQLIDHPQRQQIRVVLNGIDTTYFQPTEAPKEYELLFCGNMAYPPNIDAAVFLAEEILPLVRQQHPHARLLIAGTTPTARVQTLATEGVTISGWLPDIRTAYASARVFVAPMRTGTGLQNKLLEAMAMRLPCVTTTLANAALRGTPDEQVLIGDTAITLATHIIKLLSYPTAAATLAEQGLQFVSTHYNWSASTTRLEEIMHLHTAADVVTSPADSPAPTP
ncbi:glycosyltransferase [Hymenobacter sp. NBH84]|uniref:glycosyltransferase n=1 Tax=Hymenobacter sp. NBH84 TaxID=2596915 RepID=UPI00162A8AD4|nr:glycosyltransferase [Hymenobacter sp. NBH84]QNE39700.1 glycosyltransferase [Hymenobacter sp. NBH84]